MKPLASGLLFLALLVAQSEISHTATSEETPANPQKVALIRQIIDAIGSKDYAQRTINYIVPQIRKEMLGDPTQPQAFVDEVLRRSSQRLQDVDWTQLYTPFYDKNFTLGELRQVLAFYQSPVGRKVVRLQSMAYSEMAAAAMAKGRQIERRVALQVLAEHPEYVEQIQENKRKLQAQTAAPDESVHKIGDGVSAPILISKLEPQYTQQAARAKFGGTVLLSLIVDTAGMPRNLKIVRPLGMGLDEKAFEAVSQWRFRPGMRDGKAVATQATVEVTFRIPDDRPQKQ